MNPYDKAVAIGDTSVEYKLDEKAETLTCITPLETGQYTIKIEYTGIHNDKRMGFYRTKFEVSLRTHHQLFIIKGERHFPNKLKKFH